MEEFDRLHRCTEGKAALTILLTTAEVVGENPKLQFSLVDAVLLTDCRELETSPGDKFSKDLLVFDRDDNRYVMNLSNHETESPMTFFLNTDWGRYVRTHDVRAEDHIMFYRICDRSICEDNYYVIRYMKWPRKSGDALYNTPSNGHMPDSRALKPKVPSLSKTLFTHNVAGENPRLYLNADDITKLFSDAHEILNYPLDTLFKNLVVFDTDARQYDILLSNLQNEDEEMMYALDGGWERFIMNHNAKAGDEISIYRIKDRTSEGDEYYYLMNYTKCTEEPHGQKRALPSTVHCLLKTLSTYNVARATPRLYLDANEISMLFTNGHEILSCPLDTLVKNLVVFDADARQYDMLLTNLKSDDGKLIYSLDGGWERFVRNNNAGAGDEVSIYRIKDETVWDDYYYVMKYTKCTATPHSQKRVLTPNAHCLTKILSPYDVDKKSPRLYLDANEVILLCTDAHEILNRPIDSLFKNLVVFDVDDRQYDMLLSNMKSNDGDILYPLDGGWERFIINHNAEAGDEISFYRIRDENVWDDYYYIMKYTKCIGMPQVKID